MTFFCDTHCHLTLDAYQEDLEFVIEGARNHEVKKILVPGIDLESSRAAIKLANQFEFIYAAIGVHPHDAQYWKHHWCNELKEMASNPKVVAIGEIGLDFYRNYSPPAIQKYVFQVQLEIALELKLPVILHERNSADEMWPMILNATEQFTPNFQDVWGVLHSFSGTLAYAQKAICHGLLIGISGPVTYTKAVEKQQMTMELPLDRILLETDGPYLPPHPFRGKRNLPQYIPIIAEKIAQLKQCPIEQVRDVTTSNANSLFFWRSDH
jgi:TatD DNase family protein